MTNFKVGDVLRGTSPTNYAITNSEGTYEVISINNKDMRIKILTHTSNRHIGEIYSVDFEWFEKLNLSWRERLGG